MKFKVGDKVIIAHAKGATKHCFDVEDARRNKDICIITDMNVTGAIILKNMTTKSREFNSHRVYEEDLEHASADSKYF